MSRNVIQIISFQCMRTQRVIAWCGSSSYKLLANYHNAWHFRDSHTVQLQLCMWIASNLKYFQKLNMTSEMCQDYSYRLAENIGTLKKINIRSLSQSTNMLSSTQGTHLKFIRKYFIRDFSKLFKTSKYWDQSHTFEHSHRSNRGRVQRSYKRQELHPCIRCPRQLIQLGRICYLLRLR